MDIDAIIQKYPKLNFIKSPAFESLPTEKKEFLLGCVEDALFWIEHEKKPDADDGFKFLGITYGLDKAEAEANAKGLQGKDREEFLKPFKQLMNKYNPHSV